MNEREKGELAAIDALLRVHADPGIADRITVVRPSPWPARIGWMLTAAACLLAAVLGFQTGTALGGGVAATQSEMPLGLRPWRATR